MQVQSLGLEDLPEEGIASHSSILTWRTLWKMEPHGLKSAGSQRVRHNWSDLAQHRSACSVMSDSLRPHGLQPFRLLCPWDFPGKNTGVGCHFLLQGSFLTQGSNLCLLHCKWILYHWTIWDTYIYIYIWY